MSYVKNKVVLTIFLIVSVVSVLLYYKFQNFTVGNESHSIPIYSVDTDKKCVSITFDVNWAKKDNLGVILDILDKYNIKGTFFLMGGWINYNDSNLNYTKDIAKRGQEIGIHSYSHCDFTKVSSEKIAEELEKTNETIEKCTGKRTNLFRFPSGSYNNKSVDEVKKRGYIPIQWDADSVDWKEEGLDIEYKRVMKRVSNGSILLFHNNAKYTPENLERIIKELKDKEYLFKTVGDMIYKDDYYIDNNGRQYKLIKNLKNK
ncbi:polysaccharide deacetylase family protein [Clostridium sp. BJN0001]|uniref:polysaccharide deacetylase family protein n=1 Tax=Clostridium sp. BJN0001 TaxID=2930219 RepID=UPI001FD5E383|nr:polysaccharide deacetylase family protein [Clostridium sp. BJN0001]